MVHVLTFVLTLLPIALLGLTIPWFGRTRRGILFGVSVSLEFADSPEAHRVLQRYRRDAEILVMAVLAAVTLTFWFGAAGQYAIFFTSLLGIPLELIGAFFLWRRGHLAIKPHETAVPLERSADLNAPSHAAPILVAALAVLPLIVEAFWLHRHWGSLPARWPQHWNAFGVADGWATRSAGSVYGPLLTGGLMMVLFVAVMAFLSRASGTQAGQRSRVLAPLAALAWLLSVLFCSIGLLPLLHPLRPTTVLSAVIVQLIASFAVVVWLLWRSGMVRPPSSAEPYDGTPDAMWHAGGLFYYNPADASIIVPKRFGWGWTLNFARPASWAYIAGILTITALVACIPLLTRN